jgi:hypothetical protein
MSKNNNVNPGQYKVGGREHAEGDGEAIVHDQEKQKFSTAARETEGKEGQPNFIPGEAPVGQPGRSSKKGDGDK